MLGRVSPFIVTSAAIAEATHIFEKRAKGLGIFGKNR